MLKNLSSFCGPILSYQRPLRDEDNNLGLKELRSQLWEGYKNGGEKEVEQKVHHRLH